MHIVFMHKQHILEGLLVTSHGGGGVSESFPGSLHHPLLRATGQSELNMKLKVDHEESVRNESSASLRFCLKGRSPYPSFRNPLLTSDCLSCNLGLLSNEELGVSRS